MFLIELGKFWHKFQVNRVSRTQDMAKTLNMTQFRTDSENARNSFSRIVQMKI